jgi:metallophosphoesterase superfamily enzyme
MRPLQNPPPLTARAEIAAGLWADSRLALWIAAERLLVIADLHWGYSASHRARGNLLPAWGDDELEQRLHGLLADYRPAEMIWLGDIVHAAEGAARAEAFVRHASVPITLIIGNHDRRWRCPHPTVSAVTRGRYFLHHGDTEKPAAPNYLEVIGHHHPAVSCEDHAGTRLKLPALVANAHRLILPAFSPWAAGTPWNERCLPQDTLWVIAPNRIFPFRRPARAGSGIST